MGQMCITLSIALYIQKREQSLEFIKLINNGGGLQPCFCGTELMQMLLPCKANSWDKCKGQGHKKLTKPKLCHYVIFIAHMLVKSKLFIFSLSSANWWLLIFSINGIQDFSCRTVLLAMASPDKLCKIEYLFWIQCKIRCDTISML